MTKIDYVNAWFYLKADKREGFTKMFYFPVFDCIDGFSISIQGSEYSYSTPRETDELYYKDVELGYPTMIEPALMQWADDEKNPTNTVYGYVPVEVVNNILEMHGISPDLRLKLKIADKRRKNEILQRTKQPG